MRAGWLHLRASRLFLRHDYAAASAIYEKLLGFDASDAFATYMLAICYEQQHRITEALDLAETNARRVERKLSDLQLAARLAIAAGEHDKATAYVQQALALPEIVTEMPEELPRSVMWMFRLIGRIAMLRKRTRPAIRSLEPGARAVELLEWKQWAHQYLAWRAGREPPAQDHRVH
jgi:tetratricopeptide (TPR) repeat protein